MPVNHTMSDGTPVIIRCMRHDEVALFFDALKSAAESGYGYGYDELPNLNLFASEYVDGRNNFVIEDAQTGDIVSYCNAGSPSNFARTADPVIADGGNMIIMPNYRRRNWYVELANFMWQIFDEMETPVSKVCGYQTDTAVTNLPVNLTLIKFNYVVNGILPRAIYIKGQGWVDVVLCFNHRPKKLPAKL